MDLVDITNELQRLKDEDKLGFIWSPLFGSIPLRNVRVIPYTQIYVDWYDGITYVFDKYGRYNMYEYDDGNVKTSYKIMLLPSESSDWSNV